MCSRCQAEVVQRKQICCNLNPSSCLRLVHLNDLNNLVNLVQGDFDQNAVLFDTGAPQIGAATNAQKRLVCYRKLFRLLHGIGLTGIKVGLPSCCRVMIDTTYP